MSLGEMDGGLRTWEKYRHRLQLDYAPKFPMHDRFHDGQLL